MGATRQRELTLQLGRKRVSISDELLTVVVSFLRTRPVWPARQLVSLACDRFSEQGREEAGSGRGNRMTACGNSVVVLYARCAFVFRLSSVF